MQDLKFPIVATPLLAARSAFAGVLMGLANLVPGISGGTMLLAAGVYPRFIEAIAELTTLKFRKHSLVVLGCVIAAAVVAIGLLSGTVKGLVVEQRWIMYSLFIGLTLGGLPVVWQMVRHVNAAVIIGAVIGFVGMAALALAQASGFGAGDGGEPNVAFLFLAGVAGASAMILPGVSGAYLLLVLGVYVPILGGVDAFKEAALAQNWPTIWSIGIKIVLPVGVGVVVGVVGVSHVLKWVMVRFESATLGVLMGLLVGAVVGLWPFQRGVPPQVGDIIKAQQVTAETLATIDPADWRIEIFQPTASQALAAVALIMLGFILTMVVARLGREKPERTVTAEYTENTERGVN